MDDITETLAGLTDRVIAYRVLLMKGLQMDRLREKLAMAGGVVKRATDKIEAEADALIAREAELAAHTKQCFAPHHKALEAHKHELDGLEDALRLVNNDPLDGSSEGSPEVEKCDVATFQGT